MASNPHVDLSDDIRGFRRVLSWTLTQKVDELKKELTRLEQLCKSIDESEIGATEAPRPSSCREDGEPTCVTDADARKRKLLKKGQQLKSSLKIAVNITAKDILERIKGRMALIHAFLRIVRDDLDDVQSYYILRSTLQFAVMKKGVSDLTCDDTIIRPYTDFIPTPNEVSEFLIYYWWYAPELTRWFLTNLSNKYNTLAIIHAVCDNTYKYQIEAEREQALSKVAEMILSLGNDQIALSKDICAYMVALNNTVLQCLTVDISIAKQIDYNSLFYSTFPLDEDQIKDLKFGPVELSASPEGKDNYRKALIEALHDAEEKGLISQNERRAIYGDIERTSSEIEPYIEPNDEDKLECLPGLKPALRNMAKIRKIAEITAEAGCIEEKDIPLFIYRLSGNGRPDNLDPISWKPKYSEAAKHKASPGLVRNPNEFYFLLHHMYKGRGAENKDTISRFFAFDDDTALLVRKALTYKNGPGQMAKSAPADFRSRLHNEVDPVIFPY